MFLLFFCVFALKTMSGKMYSSSSSVIQAQKLVDQLRVEASMERFKVGKNLNHLLICFIEVGRLI